MPSPDRPADRTSRVRAARVRGAVFAAALSGTFAAGCGNTIYAIQVNSSSAKLEEARELGAEQYAPYEFWFAQEHLDKAQSEAAEADYSDAINLAEVSEEYADKAIQLAKNAHRGAGR